MTVQELISKLESIRDKNVSVTLVEWSIQNTLMTRCELTTERILVQPPRVAIVID